jgi:hypothetical protein
VLLIFANERCGVMFRFRLLGEMWQHNFMRVISVSGNSVAFRDEKNGKVVVLCHTKMMMQLEREGPAPRLQPNCPYEVVAT